MNDITNCYIYPLGEYVDSWVYDRWWNPPYPLYPIYPAPQPAYEDEEIIIIRRRWTISPQLPYHPTWPTWRDWSYSPSTTSDGT